MVDAIRESLGAWYLYIKFVHLLAAMMWSWSTAVAYVWYIKDAWKEWADNPQDSVLKARRDWAFEQFDRGVILEHLAFPVILVTGPLMIVLAGWPLMTPWLAAKLSIVLLVFIPIEIFDYWLSHLGGNKTRIRKQNDPKKFERFIQIHWLFFRITTPLIVIFMPLVIFLATVKPALW
jgi:uncharacterized membrane protein